jgi:NAD(P)-dependent dehydrogenase (short-subunit alcohol dehydrogenase family)
MKVFRTAEDIPSQQGRIAVVTGANSGLGKYTAQALAGKGARVIMACRNLEKGEVARQQILQQKPQVEPEVWQLDLASLDSVKAFSDRFLDHSERLDLLINNAGLMAIPEGRTREGFECSSESTTSVILPYRPGSGSPFPGPRDPGWSS